MNTKATLPHKMTGFAMRGGIDINEEMMEQFPDSDYYWGGGAKWAKVEIYNLLGLDMSKPEYKKEVREQMERIFSRFYHPKNTWMRICKKTEHCLDLLKALHIEEKK